VAFDFRVDPKWLGISVAAAIFMGLAGGFLPAWKAARMPITNALRDA
jgi:putative ABC transport system permease protein